LKLLLLVHGATWDRRYQASALAASATALGDRVDLALFFGALDAWVKREWDRLDPAPPLTAAQIDAVAFPPLSSLVEGARATGLLKLYGCSASARLLGFDPAHCLTRLDTLAGWPTFAQKIAEADRVVGF
jgi:predicted peroxiredoxin